MKEHLIIFTRYPEPGKTKTRLIPALGTEGAALLHRWMAEHTLAQARQLQQMRELSIAVQFVGGDAAAMATWLGAGLLYQPQTTGDLGDRMAHAFQTAFLSEVERVVTIGTDCPDLSTALMAQAFESLHDHDLVLGSAQDGGYYLIGLSWFIPELFQNIAWSTAEVLQQTVAIAQALNLSIADLPTLSDVDHPADLPIWENSTARILPHPIP